MSIFSVLDGFSFSGEVLAVLGGSKGSLLESAGSPILISSSALNFAFGGTLPSRSCSVRTFSASVLSMVFLGEGRDSFSTLLRTTGFLVSSIIGVDSSDRGDPASEPLELLLEKEGDVEVAYDTVEEKEDDVEEDGENLLEFILPRPELGAGIRLTTFLVTATSGPRVILPPPPPLLSFLLLNWP